MKIAVSSCGKDLDSQLDSRFGRCSYFLVVNPDDMRFDVFKNESAALGGGAGIQSAQFVVSKGVDAVITGNCGPNAVSTLSAAGIVLFTGQKGTVKEVVGRFTKGELRAANEPTVDSHFGMPAGEGNGAAGAQQGAGRGMGRGMGGRPGMGPGRGGIRALGRGANFSGQGSRNKNGSGSASKDVELEMLRKKADDLNQQLKSLITRINQLETGR